MKRNVALVLAVSSLVFGLAVLPATPVSAQGQAQQTVAQRCFEHHKFGAQPVDVAKTADGETVLAQTSWNWHDAIGCYLTLDPQSLAVLQAAPPPQILPNGPTSASKQCFGHHKFGESPVDVAKTADRQTVLARLSWGYHESIGCYLTLDSTALATLRAAYEESARPVVVPAPEDRAVLAEQRVGASGAVVSHGQVTVSVPAGTFDSQAEVAILEPLGEFGDELGGEVVSVEHSSPVRAPVTVKWDVSHLSEADQRLVVLVRWDETLGDWLPGDADFEISGGMLTARIQEWSFWTWIANASQTIQELLGRRIDAPQCSGGALHGWVSETTEPDEDTNAASIRMCYENGPDESIRVRLANNRVFGQVVYINGSYGLWDADLKGFDLSIGGLAEEAAHHLLTVEGEEATVFLPPLRYVDVVIQRPTRAGPHHISFRNEVNAATIVADGFIYLSGEVATWLGQRTNPILQAFLEVVFECGGPQLAAIAQTTGIKQSLEIALGVLKSCVPKIADHKSELGSRFRQKIAENVEGSVADQIDEVSSKLGAAVRILKIVELVGYLADLAVEGITGSLNWTIRGQGRIRDLGDWTPTCAHPDQDSNRLLNHLAWREPFTPTGTTNVAEDLHRFDEWEPSAKKAVEPLKICSDGHKAAVAAEVADWYGGEEPAASGIVSNLILDMVTPDPAGGYTAITAGSNHSCAITTDQKIACWGDNTYGQLHEPPGNHKYTAVSAGSGYTCGLRADQTIACWGLDDRGETEAPTGRYTAVDTGINHSCGLRTDQTIICWGSNRHGRTDSPAGRYTAVSVGTLHNCGLRTDQTIACWGYNDTGETNPPPGRYIAVEAGTSHTCGLRTDQTIACWGGRSGSLPEDKFTSISVYPGAGLYACGLRTDQTITCWDGDDPLQGVYTALATGEGHSCAITEVQTIACWGKNDHGQTDDPSNAIPTVTAPISAGDSHSCAITEAQTIACWGNNNHGQTNAPAGNYTAITAGTSHTCAITEVQTIACWGQNNHGQTDAPAGTYSAIAAGDSHTCAITTRGKAECWGNNNHGQTVPRFTFHEYTRITAAHNHTCAITTGNSISCWGHNNHGQTDVPERKYTAIAAGREHTCAIATDQTITCWGNNNHGQSNPQQTPTPRSQPSPLSTPFTAISAGLNHTCALTATGDGVCWGYNRDGQTDVPNGLFRAISAGVDHTCAIRTHGSARCWTDEGHPQINRTRTDAPPGQFSAVDAGGRHTCWIATEGEVVCYGLDPAPDGRYTTISAGGVHSCGIKTDQTAVCWGRYDYGQNDAPGGHYSAISAGGRHTCAIRVDQAIACWGNNDHGQMDAPGGHYSAISAGGEHTCALTTQGAAVCWGNNFYGQTEAPAWEFRAISAGSFHTCALTTQGAAVCWGKDNYGQSSPPDYLRKSESPKAPFVALSTGSRHACALDADGRARCWGSAQADRTNAPDRLFVSISAAHSHTCAIDKEDRAVCWGDVYGQWTHLHTNHQTSVPAGRYSAISAGREHTCALTTQGTATCWGLAGRASRTIDYGQADAPPGRYSAISAGGRHTCALTTQGTATCWGNNDHGQTDVPAGRYSAISAGGGHTCALTTQGTATCWGWKGYDPMDIPAGHYSAISAGGSYTCALTTQGRTVCRGKTHGFDSV